MIRQFLGSSGQFFHKLLYVNSCHPCYLFEEEEEREERERDGERMGGAENVLDSQKHEVLWEGKSFSLS